MVKQFIKQNKILLIIVFSIIASFAIKACFMSYVSYDMSDCLLRWVHNYQSKTAIECLKDTISDYPALYNYFLMIIAHILPCNDTAYIHAIKLFTIIFDIVNAIAAYFIVKQYTKNKLLSACAFAFFLIIPDVIVNGALWGQCDIIFTSMFLWFIYFVSKNKSHLAMVFLSLAFCLKLQTIFIFPFVLLLILKRRIKIYQLFYIPIIYLLVAAPELAAGHPIKHVLMPYTNHPGINYFTPNIYFWLPFTSYNENIVVLYVAIAFACLILLSAVIYCYIKKVELNYSNIIFLSFASCFIAPFVMPKMHERYFFAAEIISIVYFLVKRSKSSLLLTISTSVMATIASVNVLTNNGLARNIVNSVNMIFSISALALLIYEFAHEVLPSKKEGVSLSN